MIDLLFFLVLCLIWGSTWLAIKIGLDSSPPFLGAGFRFLIAAAFLYILTAMARKCNFSFGKSWFNVVLAGLFTYPLAYSLVYWGEQYIESGLSAVLFAIMPFFVAFFAHLMIPGEKIRPSKIVGMLIGFGGILIVFADSLKIKGGRATLGMVCIIVASSCSALGTIIVKKHLKHINPLPLTAIQTTIGALVLLIVGFLSESLSNYRADSKALGSLLYLAIVGTSVAFSLYFYLLRKMEATKLSMIAFITPIVALVLGILFRAEAFDRMNLIGSALVLIGVFIVVKGKIAKPVSSASPSPSK